MSLDAVESGGDDRIRQYRRSTVTKIQSYNSQLDNIKRRLHMPIDR